MKPGADDATTVRTAIAEAVADLAAAGVDGAALDARVLMADVLGAERLSLAIDGDRILTAKEATTFALLIARRRTREPVSHILGIREFWSLPFRVTPDTLAPRPDSETLVEAVLNYLKGARRDGLRLLDLGTGTGCLILALLSELPGAIGFAVDLNPRTAAAALDNARRLGLENRFRVWAGDWDAALDPRARFDVVLSNPPYITDGEYGTLAPEVARFEPEGALRAGADGLDAYRRIIPAARTRLLPGAALFLEIGAGQRAAVEPLCGGVGFRTVRTLVDLAGRDRVVVAAN